MRLADTQYIFKDPREDDFTEVHLATLMGKLKVLAQEATNRATANGTFVPVGAPLCEGPIRKKIRRP